MFQDRAGAVNARARTTTSPLIISCKVRWRAVNSATSNNSPLVARVR